MGASRASTPGCRPTRSRSRSSCTPSAPSSCARDGGSRRSRPAAGASRLVLDDAPIAATLEDPRALARARAGIRTAVGALLVGAARGTHEYAMRYATERTAFGRPIAHHQALVFLIADLATAVDIARLAVWRAAAALDRGESAEWEGANA